MTYDRYRVEGMTAKDMIEGISAICSLQLRRSRAGHRAMGGCGVLMRPCPHGRWIQLCHGSVLKKQDGLAQAAISEAVRLEAQEAPQRELEK